MTLLKKIQERSASQCELCNSDDQLELYAVPPSPKNQEEDTVLLCGVCRFQLENLDQVNANQTHNESIN